MKAVIFDLNNFSRYPTMSVGYMAAILREIGAEVEVMSPFAVGVKGYPRVTRPRPWGFYDQWLRYRTATTSNDFIRTFRSKIVNQIRPTNTRSREQIVAAAHNVMAGDPDIILISAYTMYYDVCVEICNVAARKKVPVVVGGPFFNHPEIADLWLEIPGITAIFGGEPENVLPKIAKSIQNGGNVNAIAGLSTPNNRSMPAKPLSSLDDIPFPDYNDFPWHLYPIRIIPMMTGRGCGWGVCKFCSDVVTSSGRSFRSRSPANVLDEMDIHHKRYDSNLFTFLDLKLNSDLEVWRSLIERARSVVPGAKWTASLHAHAKGKDGLDARELKEARRGGLIRLTTGLESGSGNLLNLMAKGTSTEVLSQFIRHAYEADISVRLTTIVGFPGETAGDVIATSQFLDRHYDYIDRVVINRFSLQLGTPILASIKSNASRHSDISSIKFDAHSATYNHTNHIFSSKAHRRAMRKVLYSVHKINRKKFTNASAIFEGVM